MQHKLKMCQWLTVTPDQASPNHLPCLYFPSIRHSSSNVWAGVPVQLGSCPDGHSDEASGADEAWRLPQTESVRLAVEHITQTTSLERFRLNQYVT